MEENKEEKETKRKAGRPKGSLKQPADVLIRKAIGESLERYFVHGLYKEDMELNKTARLKLHMDLLPYVLSKKESIKTLLNGMDEVETDELVQRLKDSIK
ncbi:hypothetical protein [Arenibacter nanhaiticus]|uniref:hypothetical protein n=1 Tax=Arenibacter nanhaiticus TaxID=558155 RepID=UPI00116036BA|nr:hypothetical protein [Arenibacter nanhaiticus]